MIEELINGRLLLRSNHLGRDALDKLLRMRQDGVLVDVTVRAGDRSIPAHRLVLCLCSSYFEAMFGRSGFAESGEKEVLLEGIDPSSLESLVDFFYTGLLRVDSADDAFSIMQAADLLLLDNTKRALGRYLQQVMNLGTCVSCKRAASAFGLEELGKAADRFLRRNFERLAFSAENILGYLNYEEMRELLSCEEKGGKSGLFVTREDAVAEAVESWAESYRDQEEGEEEKEEEEDRATLAKKLFEGCVNLEDLSESWRSKLEEKYSISSTKKETGRTRRRRRRRRSCGKLVVAAGFDSKHLEYLDPDDPEAGWARLTEAPGMRYGLGGAGMAAYGSRVLLTGGVGGKGKGVLGASDRFLVYDLVLNEWWDGPPMLTPRKSHCSGVHSGYLYAAGGTDVQKPVTAAERIRLEGLNRETKWEPLPELGDWLNGEKMVPLSADDTNNNRTLLACLSSYGATSDKALELEGNRAAEWKGIPLGGENDSNSRVERDRPGVAAAGGNSIVVAGGAEGRKSLATVEVYSASEAAWKRLPDLVRPREGPAVAAVKVEEEEGAENGNPSKVTLLIVAGGKGSGGTTEVLRFKGEDFAGAWSEVENCRLSCQNDEYTAVVLKRI